MQLEYDLDEISRHNLYLERLASGGVNSVVDPAIGKMLDDIILQLGAYEDITGIRSLNTILVKIQEAIDDNAPWDKLLEDDLNPLAEYEAEWQASYAEAATGLEIALPLAASILELASKTNMILDSGSTAEVFTFSQAGKNNSQSIFNQISSIIRRGFLRETSSKELKASVRRLIDGKIRRDAQTLARTAYLHYATQATEAVNAANTNVLEEYYYIITFDNRLSDICRAINEQFNQPNNRLKVGDPKAPTPPHHYGCRTRRIAVPSGFVLTGTRSAVGGQRGQEAVEAFADRQRRINTAQRRRREEGEDAPTNLVKASQVRYRGRKDDDIFKAGQIDAEEGYAAWLRRQPRFFVEDALGPTRAKLFLDDGVQLSRFSDALARPLTIAQIIEREGITL